jgi:hypothetical protein
MRIVAARRSSNGGISETIPYYHVALFGHSLNRQSSEIYAGLAVALGDYLRPWNPTKECYGTIETGALGI